MKTEECNQKAFQTKYNNLPLFSALERKDYRCLVACCAFEINDFYSKQQNATIKVPP